MALVQVNSTEMAFPELCSTEMCFINNFKGNFRDFFKLLVDEFFVLLLITNLILCIFLFTFMQ